MSVVLVLLLAESPRPRPGRPHFDLTVRSGPPRAQPPESRSGRLERALASIVAGLAGDEREDVVRARLAAARAYQADGDAHLAAVQLRVVAEGAGEPAARARLELAHLARRSGNLGGARVGYLRSLLDVELPRRAREAAVRAWAGMERDSGDAPLSEALRVVLALDARLARDRVRACSVLVRAREDSAPRLAWWLRRACVAREWRAGIGADLRERLADLARSSR